MKTKLTLLFFSLFVSAASFSQDIVDVTDQTIKIGGLKEEQLLFGFAEGDRIIFNFKEIDGKELKELEILEYPASSKYSDYKTSKVENKTITVGKKSVYIFRFKNSSLAGRVCKIQVQRIPASQATKSFNSTVTWAKQQDTTWNTLTKDVVVGYDTVYSQKTKRELVKTEQSEELIMTKMQRVHSTTNENGNKTWVYFSLPQNQLYGNTTKKVIAWAYWVGVGEEANQAWKSNAKTISSLVKGAATYYTTPLGALAIGAITDLAIPKVGEDVFYAVTDQQNKDLFMGGYQYRLVDQGKGVAGYKKFTHPGLCQGTYFICLSNDNVMQGVDADIKVVAIVEANTYEDRTFTDADVKPRVEKQLYKEPQVTSNLVPVTGL